MKSRATSWCDGFELIKELRVHGKQGVPLGQLPNTNKKHFLNIPLHVNETISSSWALKQSLELTKEAKNISLGHVRKEQALAIYLEMYWFVSCKVQ